MKPTEEQLKVIQSNDRQILLSASAGSGKTEVLSLKVIELFKKGYQPKDLLVLTFTDKAAFEMKDRIIDKCSKEPFFTEEFERQLNCAHIQTFDSYYLYIVKKYHSLIGISSNINVFDGSMLDIYKLSCIDDTVNNEINRILVTYESENNELHPDVNDKDAMFVLDSCSFGKEKVSDLLTLAISSLKSNEIPEIEVFSKTEFTNLYKKFISEKIEFLSLLYGRTIRMMSDTSKIDDFDAAYLPLFDLEPETFIEQIKIFNHKSKALSDEDKVLRQSFKKVFDSFKKNLFLLLDTVDNQYESYLNSLERTKTVLKLLSNINAKLENVKTINCSYTFTDIAEKAVNLFKNYPLVRKNEKYKFVLVDEYQDTSYLQEEFLNNIDFENILMVGDVKQSIYMFRQADYRIIQNKFNKFKAQPDVGTNLMMSLNFRSRKEILDCVNEMFSNLMKDKFGGSNYRLHGFIGYGLKSYDNAKENYPYGMNYLYPSFLANINQSEFKAYHAKDFRTFDAKTIACDIIDKINNKFQVLDKKTNKLRDCKFSDFAILGRSLKSSADIYRKEFNNYGIPLNILRDEVIRDESITMALTQLFIFTYTIRYKYSKNHLNHLFASVARSFLFNYSDKQIYDVITQNKIENTDIFKICSKISEDNLYNYEDIILKELEEFKIINVIDRNVDIKDSFLLIDAFLEKVKLCKTLGYSFKETVEFFNTINENQIESKMASSIDDSAANLMTIHKSKGLEYPVCYIIDTNSAFKLTKASEKIYNDEVGYLLEDKSGKYKKDFRFYLANSEYELEGKSEELRLFYVALTRTREICYFVNSASFYKESDCVDPTLASCYNDFIACSKVKINRIAIDLDKSLKINNYNQNINHFELLNFKPEVKVEHKKASKRLIIGDDEISIKKLDYGTYIHSIMELIDFNNPDLSFIEDEKERKLISDVLNIDELKEIRNSKIYKEYEFYDDEQHLSGVIDLLSISDGTAKIFDYKLKKIDDEDYAIQLKFYKNYIERVFKLNVKTYLVSILGKRCEEVIL